MSRQMDFGQMTYMRWLKRGSVILILLAAGFFIGLNAGNLMERRMMTGESFVSAILKMPSGRFIDVSRAISSGDQLSRIAGYYGMTEMGLATPDFLFKRYKMETDVAVKNILSRLLKYHYPDAFRLLEKSDKTLPKPGKGRELRQQEFIM